MKVLSMKGLKSYRTRNILRGCSLLLLTPFTQALEFSSPVGDEKLNADFSTTLNYGAQWRLESPGRENSVPRVPVFNPANVEQSLRDYGQMGRIANGNDGDRNFDKGDLVSSRLSALFDSGLSYGNYGAFVRARLWYDGVYRDGRPANVTATSVPGILPIGDYNGNRIDRFQRTTADYLGEGFEFLDAYAYSSFTLFDHQASFKLGRQVISWGESLSFANSISSAQNPIDVIAAISPGVELKEVYLPTNAAYGQLSLTDALSFQLYYQFEHRPNQLAPAGSFWSDQDMLGIGGYSMVRPAKGYLLQQERVPTSDSGQWGAALRYTTAGGTQYGVYSLTYHDKTPSVTALDNVYVVDYKENIRLYGVSFSTLINKTSVAGELSYRPNSVAILDTACNAALGCVEHLPAEPTRAEMFQAQLSAIHVFEPTWLFESDTLAGEIVAWRYGAIDRADNGDRNTLSPTNTPAGAAFMVKNDFNYNNVFEGVNLTIPVVWQYGLDGTSLRTNSRGRGSSIFSTGVKLQLLGNLEGSLIYSRYDSPSHNQYDDNFYSYTDRDNIALSVKYSL